jgi:hypothetical protein
MSVWRREAGAALIIVLLFVTLLTTVILAFFSHATNSRSLSESSFHQARAEELAQSGLEMLVAALRQEMEDGSRARTGSIMRPLSAAYLRPARGNDVDPVRMPNLLRVSGTAGVSFPGKEFPVSLSSSLTESINGRHVSPARWNRHYLVPRREGATPTDATPVPEFPAPHWIYISNLGPEPIDKPRPDVIGRFAYAIYDVSGLLDANVAGFPSSLPVADMNAGRRYGYGNKGSLAFADLAHLFPSGTRESKFMQIDRIVGWRNYASAQPESVDSNQFPKFWFDPVSRSSAHRFYDYVISNTTGFLRTHDGVWNGRTDQVFANRQQLLAFRRAAGFSPEVLQYLGTFSRAVTSPSSAPARDAHEWGGNSGSAGAFAYRSKAFLPGVPNPDVLSLETGASLKLVRYGDDGTKYSEVVPPGVPFLQRRFSLAKLSWIGAEGPNREAMPNATDPGFAIEACFGLRWSPENQYWTYVASPPGSSRIKTLSEILAEKRLPNFFELLQAGILHGSLGQHPGEPGMPEETMGPAGRGFSDEGSTPGYSQNPARHIIQIGANAIDQADPDSFPTAIYFPIQGTGGAAPDSTSHAVWGVENLPYLHGISLVAFQDSRESASPWRMWLVPELWNPHQEPAGETGGRPSHFRLRAYGGVAANWQLRQEGVLLSLGGGKVMVDFNSNPSLEDDVAGYRDVIFAASPDSAFREHPALLAYDRVLDAESAGEGFRTARINFNDGTAGGDLANTAERPGEGALYKSFRFAGIFCGQTAYPKGSRAWPEGAYEVVSKIQGTPELTLVLEYYRNGSWHPYTAMSRIVKPLSNITLAHSSDVRDGALSPGDSSFVHAPDPRTDRFSVMLKETDGWPHEHTAWSHGNKETLRRVRRYYPRTDAGFIYGFETGEANVMGWMRNRPNDPGLPEWFPKAFYHDADGVVRPADGARWRWRADTRGDGMYTLHSTALSPGASDRRPAILDRPFRSAAELGYVFRDLPARNVDFSSPLSADTALLDLFAASDEPEVVAGQVHPQAISLPVLKALLAGTLKNEQTLSVFEGTQLNQVAASLHEKLQTADPIESRGSLVSVLSEAMDHLLENLSTGSTLHDLRNKAFAEAPVRAVAPVANVRTWNLMLDVVAQTGMFPPSTHASTPEDIGEAFLVRGERRYWLHLAMDRFTGEIVGRQLEAVDE